MGAQNEDDVSGIRLIAQLGRLAAQELVRRVDLFEHVPSVRVLVRVIILRHLEVGFPDLGFVMITLGQACGQITI